MNYAVTALTTRPGEAAPALAKLRDNLPATKNALLGCWYSDIGALNRIMLIHALTDAADMAAARDRLAASADPFGVGAHLESWTTNDFASLPYLDPARPGNHGAFYEFRTYRLKPIGLAGTLPLWQEWLPGRLKLSPIYAAMYSTTGTVPRLMHIWPWPSLDARQATRAKAVETGVWPPKGGAVHFADMQVDIYLPAPFSPSR